MTKQLSGNAACRNRVKRRLAGVFSTPMLSLTYLILLYSAICFDRSFLVL
jgi:RNase P protein component